MVLMSARDSIGQAEEDEEEEEITTRRRDSSVFEDLVSNVSGLFSFGVTEKSGGTGYASMQNVD